MKKILKFSVIKKYVYNWPKKILDDWYRSMMYARCPAISREHYEHNQFVELGYERDVELGYLYMSPEKNNIIPILTRHNALSVSDWKLLLAECGLNF